jgi:hypothetical protein
LEISGGRLHGPGYANVKLPVVDAIPSDTTTDTFAVDATLGAQLMIA